MGVLRSQELESALFSIFISDLEDKINSIRIKIFRQQTREKEQMEKMVN